MILLATVGSVLAAGGADTNGDAVDLALRYGITPAIVLVLVLTKRLWTAGAYEAQVTRADDEAARADRNEGKVDAMVDLFRSEVTPALVTATKTNADAAKLIERIVERGT